MQVVKDQNIPVMTADASSIESCGSGDKDTGEYTRPDNLLPHPSPIPYFNDRCGEIFMKIIGIVDYSCELS